MNRTRKLSAILFADIVGYTSLMQRDEVAARQLLDKFHSTLGLKVGNHKGRVINNYGDGCVCTFDSAISAVQCAQEVQTIFQTAPEVPVRVGLHSGDVFFEADNVFGNSVNIASRIESIGVPGAILFSEPIKRHISNQKVFEVQSLGDFEFKNVDDPIEVFALANKGFVIPKREEMKGKLKTPASKRPSWLVPLLSALVVGLLIAGYYYLSKDPPPTLSENGQEMISSIAVFPFDVKGSPDIAYLGEGIVDLISTQLNEIPQLNSIDPNRIFSKLDQNIIISRDPKRATALSKAYGATKFILGSLVQIGEDLQISATKYDALGNEIIRESVKSSKDESLSQSVDELIQKLVADELKATGHELESLGAMTSNNLESLKLYLQGEQAFRKIQYSEARDLFSEATKLDSTFALAFMRLYEADSWIGWRSNQNTLNKWGKYKNKMPYKWRLFYEATVLNRKPDLKAIDAYKSLIQRYGDTPAFHNGLAEFYFHLNPVFGRSPTEAKPYLLKTIELDPGNQEVLFHLGQIAVMENDMNLLEEAIALKKENTGELEIQKLIIKDTVTDADIEHALGLTPYSVFLTRLYMVSEGKAFHNKLIERIVQMRPSEFGKIFANSANYNTTGRERQGFAAWMDLAKIGYTFGSFNMEQITRCVPATLMATEEFLPFSDHYELLYQETKDKDNPWDTYAAIKYTLALNKKEEVNFLKSKLQNLATDPPTRDMVDYFEFSIKAFETKMAGDNNLALLYIDSAYNAPVGYWESQCVFSDKTILAANTYADLGDFEKAISYFDHSYVIVMGGDILYGYRNYKLSQWYEALGDAQKALKKSNIFLESYKNCDAKYRSWVEEVKGRKNRLIARMN